MFRSYRSFQPSNHRGLRVVRVVRSPILSFFIHLGNSAICPIMFSVRTLDELFRYVFSPTATTLGSSAIVKVWGQNCFRTLCGSLGQIRLGLVKGSAEGSTKGSTKVPPGFHQGSTKVLPRLPVSDSLWFSGSGPCWVAKGFCGRFHHARFYRGSTKAPPKFYQGCVVIFLGQIRVSC